MAVIGKTFHFEASHQLPNHKGKCARLHGHSYEVEIRVYSSIKDPTTDESDAGFVQDFGDISDVVDPLIGQYCDHHFLNETLKIPRTTAEMIALWFFHHVSLGGIVPEEVTVQETQTCYATVGLADYYEWRQVIGDY